MFLTFENFINEYRLNWDYTTEKLNINNITKKSSIKELQTLVNDIRGQIDTKSINHPTAGPMNTDGEQPLVMFDYKNKNIGFIAVTSNSLKWVSKQKVNTSNYSDAFMSDVFLSIPDRVEVNSRLLGKARFIPWAQEIRLYLLYILFSPLG